MKVFLVLAYLSTQGIPSIQKHDWTDKGYSDCLKMATTWFKQVQAGTGRAWCAKVYI